MKTNTTKLRRALTTFAMTGAMLASTTLLAQSTQTIENYERTSTSDDDGGGYVKNPAETAIENATFTNNSFKTPAYAWNGGGVYAFFNPKAPISLSSTVFESNSVIVTTEGNAANFGGGAVYTYGNTNISLTDTVFTNNSASNPYSAAWGDSGGGAIMMSADNFDVALTLAGTNTFTGNTVELGYTKNNNVGNGGGAIMITTCNPGGNYSTLTMDPSSKNTFSGNTVTLGPTRMYNHKDVEPGISGGGAIFGGAMTAVTIDGTNEFSNNTVTEIAGSVALPENSVLAYVGGGAINNVNVFPLLSDEKIQKYYPDGNYQEALVIKGNNTFTGNSVKSENGSAYGGAIFGQDIEFDANSTSVFDGNSVTGGYYALGGAIAGIGDITISGKNTFKNNTASGHVSNGGAIYSADSLTLTGSSLFENNSVISSYSAIGGAICTENGFSISGAVFNNNSADLGGAIATGAGGKHTVKISNSTFANNNAKQGGAIECMNVQDNDVILQISDSIFNGNRAGESGGVAVVSRGVFSLSGTNEFVGNTAKELGGVFSSYGAFDVDDTITGNNLFANNSAQSGGAIYSGNDLVFSGDDSKAVFTGNTADGKPNDIVSTKSVTIQDAGTYSFDGGIVAETMGIDGSDVTFKQGSITDINGEVTLENATLNIETDGTEKTKFEVGSITDKGGNTLNIDYTGTQNGTVISGDTTGLKTRPEVEYTALQDGQLAYVSESGTNGLKVTAETTDKTYTRLSGDVAQSVTQQADSLADLGTVGADDEIVVTKAPTAKTAGLTANGALSFRSNNTTARTIESDRSTLVSGASDLTLNNVTLKSNSSENAVVSGDSVNLTGKGTAGISAPKAIESTNGVTLDGKLTVDGAITGNTTIADDAEITVTQRTDVSDDLKVGTGATLTLSDIAMTFEEVKDANGNTVVDENGKSVKTPVVDAIKIGGEISFADDAVIEISFDETFNLDAPGTYEIMKGDSLTNGGAEFSFVDAIAQLNNDMLQLSVVDGALMLDVKGFGTVPEPSTWALLILGGLGIFGVARKNRKAKK